jgi:hypothetical protein
MRSSDSRSGDPNPDIIELNQDFMVDHPAGGYNVVWNGPAFLDVGKPSGEFVRFALANLKPQWTLLVDEQGSPLPVAARYSERRLAIWWLPYEGSPTQPTEQASGGMSDADYAAALQNISATRYQGLMDAAWGIGGWSTYRSR